MLVAPDCACNARRAAVSPPVALARRGLPRAFPPLSAGPGTTLVSTSKLRWCFMRTDVTVLCVEDYLPGLFVRQLVLERNGYKVLAACGGAHALRLACKHHVDAVILDDGVGGPNAQDIAHALRRRWPYIPILLLSGAGARDVPRSFLLEVNACVAKSASPRNWLTELARILRPEDQRHIA